MPSPHLIVASPSRQCLSVGRGVSMASMIPTLVLVWLLLPAAPAAADTLTLTGDDRETFTGTVIARDRRHVTFAVDLFARNEDGQPERLRIKVPVSMVATITRDRDPRGGRVRVPRDNAPAAEKVEAAGRIIRQGSADSLDQAHRLLASVVEAADSDPANRPSREVLADLLRFRLVDLVARWQAADGDSRAAIEKELPPGDVVALVLPQYIAVLALEVRILLASSNRRSDLTEQLRHALRHQREDFIRFVRVGAGRHGGHDFDEEAHNAELAERLARITALARTPAEPLALSCVKATDDEARRLLHVEQLAAALGNPVADAVRQAMDARVSLWRQWITPAQVASPLLDDEQREWNEFADRTSATTLEKLKAATRGATEKARLDQEFAVVTAINDYRSLLGLAHMEFNVRLQRAASAQAQACLRANELNHNLGGNPASRARAAGYTGDVGENLYRAGADDETGNQPASVVQAWQLSPEHHANLLRADDFKWIAVARRGDVWCLLVGGA